MWIMECGDLHSNFFIFTLSYLLQFVVTQYSRNALY